jgi:ABC-type lipoprotein release transport system permease subunit
MMPSNWRTMVVLFLILGAGIGLFGTIYGVVLSKINSSAYNTVVSQFNTIFIVSSILITGLGVLSVYFLRSDPSMFPTYALVITHLSLFLSLLAVSFATLQQTSN